MCGAPGSMGRLYALAVAVAAVLVREAAGVGTRGGAKLVKGGKQRESLYTKEALADEVLTLPGAEALDITFNQFSGYVDVGGGKFLHYWFVESQNKPDTDPLVMWTNGGPGCSGLLGFFSEMGPFRPYRSDDGSLRLALDPLSWNKLANVLFIEAPVGVGFSYATDPQRYHIGDTGTAIDNYRLLQGFLTRFPQFRSHPLILASESYGGHYLPTLAHRIVTEQAKLNGSDPDHKLNFRGFMVGNPFTSWVNNWKATYETFWGHQLVSLPAYQRFQIACHHVRDAPDYLDLCLGLAAKLQLQIGPLNPYALDYPICTTDNQAHKNTRAQRAWLLHHATPVEMFQHASAHLPSSPSPASLSSRLGGLLQSTDDYEPCEDNYLTEYLNRGDVKGAIHVGVDMKWAECSDITQYRRADLLLPMEHIYKDLIDNKHNLDILVYSGDDDSVCGTWGTQQWMWGLGYRVKGANWEHWRTSTQQVGGYVTQFEGRLTLVTVHGAGHEVPTYKPSEAFELFAAYLNGTWFDTTAFTSNPPTQQETVPLTETTSQHTASS